MRPLLFSLLLAATLSTLPFGSRALGGSPLAARAGQSNVAAIENYARSLDRYIRRKAGAARYFADISSYERENRPARWQEFKTKRGLDAAWQNGKTYTSSNVWSDEAGEPLVTLFTFSSQSGDWVQYVTNYYRKDGTLAKSSAEYRTFMGNIIRISERLYDAGGKLLREQTRFLDLTSRRPKRVKKDEFMDMEVPLYAKTSALPFYALLKRR